MFGGVVGGDVKGAKWGILRDTSPKIGIAMVVLEIGALIPVEYFPRAGILIFDFVRWADLPKIESNGLEELILENRKTEVGAVLLEDLLVDGIGTPRVAKILDHKEGLLDFVPYLVLLLPACLHIGVAPEVEGGSDFAEGGVVIVDFHAVPHPGNEGAPGFGEGALEGLDEFKVGDKPVAFLVEDAEDLDGLEGRDVDFLVLDDLLELVEGDLAVQVGVARFEQFLELEEPSRALGG
jgi:hypothetical protein